MKLKGDLFMRLSDLNAAQELFNKVIEIRDVPWARFGLGKIQFALKKFDAAQQQFETLIANNKTFVCAYDWLAKIYKIQNQPDKVQDILRRAVEISPKALLRQRALGEASLVNEDFTVAEKAYKYVVREGKNSHHKSPEDYGGLAKVYMKTDTSGKSSMRVLGDMKQEFRNSNSTQQLKLAVVEGVLQKAMGNDDQSNAALDRAMQLFGEEPGALTSDAAMEMAKACLALGRKEQGGELIKHVVRNNHQDEKVLSAARQVFEDMGMAGEADALISSTQQEVVDLNNEGVELAKNGSLQESISLFQRAARAMPENVIVNLNAAQSLIMMMQSGGANAQHLGQAKSYLERVGDVDSGNDRYQKLLGRYHDLIKQSPQH
jgi:tetratricopeptide (TPR) repeat protein